MDRVRVKKVEGPTGPESKISGTGKNRHKLKEKRLKSKNP